MCPTGPMMSKVWTRISRAIMTEVRPDVSNSGPVGMSSSERDSIYGHGGHRPLPSQARAEILRLTQKGLADADANDLDGASSALTDIHTVLMKA